jgi:hypothetical protein
MGEGERQGGDLMPWKRREREEKGGLDGVRGEGTKRKGSDAQACIHSMHRHSIYALAHSTYNKKGILTCMSRSEWA